MNLLQSHTELCKQWHPTKNTLGPEHFTHGSNKKVWWKCQVDDHEWESIIAARVRGNGCPYCWNKRATQFSCLTTTHPEIAKQWHPTKNGNLTPDDVSAGSGKKVWWKCNVAYDHEWLDTIIHRKHGRQCPCCLNRKVVKSNCLSTTHPEIAKQWHFARNENSPENFVAGSHKKVWWICDKYLHEWEAQIVDRKNGYGCPKCNESKGEKEISNYLNKSGIIYKSQYKFKDCIDKLPLPFDFFVMDRFLIEYQGEQHYRPTNFGSKTRNATDMLKIVKNRDKIKREWCKNNNITLVEIPYWDFDKIERYISELITKL